jgi:hypothetical protein
VKRLCHPVVGRLQLTYEAMDLPTDPGLTLLAATAEPGSPSEDALKLLASWAVTSGESTVHHRDGAEPAAD